MKLHGKTIIVTGGSNSIGKELVSKLLSKDCKVIAIDFDETDLIESYRTLKEGAGNNLFLLAADITDTDSVEQLYETVFSKFAAIDGLINNAGIIQSYQKLYGLNYETLEKIFNINYYGTLYMAKYFLPHLFSRPEAHIVTAVGGNLSVSQQAAYGTSKIKSSTVLLTEGLHSELFDTNVKVTTVFSGSIRTNEEKHNGHNGIKTKKTTLPTNNVSAPLSDSRIAEIIINAMEQNIARVYTDNEPKLTERIFKLAREQFSFVPKKLNKKQGTKRVKR